MSAPVKTLARNVPAVAVALPSGPALVRLLPRHWTGRLVERCGVCDRVVQDSVHARSNGKYQLGVHQAAILLALEYQQPNVLAGIADAAKLLAADPLQDLAAEPVNQDKEAMYEEPPACV